MSQKSRAILPKSTFRHPVFLSKGMRSGIRSECCLTRRSTKRREKYGRERRGRKPSFVLSFSLRAPLSYVQIDLSLSLKVRFLSHTYYADGEYTLHADSLRATAWERERVEKKASAAFLSFCVHTLCSRPFLCQNTLPRRESTLSPSSSTCTSRSLPPPPLSPELRCFPVLTR